MTTAAGRRKRVSPVVTQSTVKGDATMGAADDDEGLDGPEEEEMGVRRRGNLTNLINVSNLYEPTALDEYCGLANGYLSLGNTKQNVK